MKHNMHIIKNTASSLWKNIPNSICLTARYSWNNEVSFNSSEKINKIVAEQNNKNTAVNKIDVTDIFVSFSGFFNLEDIKNK